MKKVRIYTFIVGILAVIAMLFQIITLTKIIYLQIRQATHQVTTLFSDKIYALKGDWEYFPNQDSNQIGTETSSQLVQVDHLWPKGEDGYAYGIATYRLTLTGLDPNAHYGLYVRDEASAYRLMVNGETVLHNGIASDQRDVYRGDMRITTGIFQSDAQGKAVLVMTIANYDRSVGGFWHAPYLGTVESIQTFTNRNAAVEIFILAVMISLSLFFLLLSSIESARRSLFMSIFCLGVAIRILSTGMHLGQELLPMFSLSIEIRMEYLSGYLLLPVVGLLIESFNFIKPIKAVRIAMIAMVPVFILFTAFATDALLEASYTWFEVLVLIYMIYALIVIGFGMKNRIEGVKAIGFATIILIVGAIFELFFPQVAYALYFCAFMFVLLLAVSVMVRFASISSRKEHLETEVLTDALTLLGNRTGLFQELNATNQAQRDLIRYILFIDLNKFKQINDVYGHKVGDAVLIEAAHRFKRSTRFSDQIYRYGGDEFVILADIAPTFEIETLIARIRANFETPFQINELYLTITLAIGYERYDPKIHNADESLKNSDMKMYEDKRRQND